MSAFEVNFYYKADGSCPVRDFLGTPEEIALAQKYRADYFHRKESSS